MEDGKVAGIPTKPTVTVTRSTSRLANSLSLAKSKRLEAQASFRDIQPSMWNVALVIGVEPVGAGASTAFSTLLLLINCIVQAMFLYILIEPNL